MYFTGRDLMSTRNNIRVLSQRPTVIHNDNMATWLHISRGVLRFWQPIDPIVCTTRSVELHDIAQSITICNICAID